MLSLRPAWRAAVRRAAPGTSCRARARPGAGAGGGVCLQCRRPGFDPWVRKILWRIRQQPTPVFLPRESQEQRNLATVNGVARVGHHLATKPPPNILVCVMRQRGQENWYKK